MGDIPKRLYLAGPMSGVPGHNFPLFHRVAGVLRARGFEVFNPAENKDGGVPQTRAYYMRLDIPALLECEGVVLLPGWRQSRGASLEVWLAIDLDLALYEYSIAGDDVLLERIAPPRIARMPFMD